MLFKNTSVHDKILQLKQKFSELQFKKVNISDYQNWAALIVDLLHISNMDTMVDIKCFNQHQVYVFFTVLDVNIEQLGQYSTRATNLG